MAEEVFNNEQKSIEDTKKSLGENFFDAVNLILNSSGKVVVTGIGKTGIIGKKISASLSSTGTQSIFMNAAEGLHGDLGIIDSNDVVLAISYSGSSLEVLNLLPSIKNIGARIICITGNLNSKLAQESEVVIKISTEYEACPLNLAPTSSTTASLVVGDALVVCLMKIKDFKPDKFALFHPGGALGRKLLTKVSNVMINVEKVGISNLKTTLIDLVKLLTKFNTGILLVTNGTNIVGVITDGDIRRSLTSSADMIRTCAEEIMTHNFKYIDFDALAVDALEMMEKYNITSLPVFRNKEIVGVVKIHQLYNLR